MAFCDVVKDYIHGHMLSMQLLMAQYRTSKAKLYNMLLSAFERSARPQAWLPETVASYFISRPF